MNITIFGASRGVGLAAVDIAVARGHTVTAVARTTGSVGGRGATAISGDVLDSELVASALAGADAVLVALGTAPSKRDAGNQAEICSRGTRIILATMSTVGLRRIVVVSSYGVGPTIARRPFPFNIVAATLLRDVMADKELQEREVREADVDWTIAQPLGLTDAPATGRPIVSADGRRETTRVSRADVATVCLKAIENRSYVRETIAISASR